MERLTAHSVKGLKLKKGKKYVELFSDKQLTLKALNRLTELEDKLENGTLIELPCKVGDTAHMVYRQLGSKEPFIVSVKITSIEIFEDGVLYRNSGINGQTVYLFGDHFNRSWFLTYEEAEKRLEELRR